MSFSSYTLYISRRVLFATKLTKDGYQVIFKSRRGTIQVLIPERFRCVIYQRTIYFRFTSPKLRAEYHTLLGALYRAMLGVTRGYREKLKTVGVGYKGELKKNRLIKLVLGYSHPVHYNLSRTSIIKFSRKNNRFTIKGPNAAIINQTAADLHFFKQPDVYKGKGVRYRGYKLLKKEGKKNT